MNLFKFFLPFAICLNSFNASAVDIIATATGNGTSVDIDAVVKLANAKDVRPVFSPEERSMLAGVGRATLAASKKFSVVGDRALIELEAQILKRALPVHLERAEIEFQLDGPKPMQSEEATKARPGSSFEYLQWAIKNIGQIVPIALDDLTSIFVEGKRGEDLGLDKAPKESTDPKRRIIIAVLDTGIDFGHSEMQDRVVENVPECRAIAEFSKCTKDASAVKGVAGAKAAKAACDTKYVGKDFDGNGYPLDCSGWNVTAKSMLGDNVWGDADARDYIGHGSHVSGIIGARSDDGEGIRGVMDNVRILPVKVITAAPTAPIRPKEVSTGKTVSGVDLTGVPKPTESSAKTEKGLGDLVARGMLYAIRSGAQVINMSLGWPADVDSNLMQQMIDLAQSRGILLVAAAGNDGTDALIRPCVFDGMICVASNDPDGAISHFSNHGAGVDIAAPGLNILSIFPTKMSPKVFTGRVGYDIKSGTSMAAPYIAGVLGRLLNAGFSPREARARMLLGAHKVSPNPRVTRAHEMIVQSGNADLAGSFTVAEQPLILPTAKRPIELPWDRHSGKIPFKLTLENAWADAKDVSINLKLTGKAELDARLSPNVLSAVNWKAGEKREFNFELLISSDRVESDLLAELSVISTDSKTGAVNTNLRYAALEITATPVSSDPEVETRSIAGDAALIAALPQSNLRSVFAIDGRGEQDYVSLQKVNGAQRIALLAQEQKAYRFKGSVDLPPTDGTLLLVERVDINNDGSSDYVLIWKKNPTADKKTPTFLFRFFDSEFRPLVQKFDGKSAAEAEYAGSESVITDSFQWINVGARKVPAWISRGTTPENEKAKYDPWNPTPIDLPDFRIYYWGEKGLATIALKDKTPVAFFPASRDEMKSGVRRMMWMIGEGTDATYEISTLSNLKPGRTNAVKFGGYRRLRASQMAPIVDLGGTGMALAGETVGVGFYSDSYRSASRVSALIPGTDANPGSGQRLIFDKVLTPQSKVDSVGLVLSGYIGTSTIGVVSQTIYEMQYEDLRSGEKASTSLKRFSFMPDFFFEKLYRPVVGDNSKNPNERLPMIYLAQGFGTGSTLEVLAPRYESGKLDGFVRPARLRLKAPAGCESMGDTVEASPSAPTRVVFTCDDRIMFVPLKY